MSRLVVHQTTEAMIRSLITLILCVVFTDVFAQDKLVINNTLPCPLLITAQVSVGPPCVITKMYTFIVPGTPAGSVVTPFCHGPLPPGEFYIGARATDNNVVDVCATPTGCMDEVGDPSCGWFSLANCMQHSNCSTCLPRGTSNLVWSTPTILPACFTGPLTNIRQLDIF